MFRWTKISPGLQAMMTLSGTRESAQPIQRTLGAWPLAVCLKKSGSYRSTSVAHCAFDDRRRLISGKVVTDMVEKLKGCWVSLAIYEDRDVMYVEESAFRLCSLRVRGVGRGALEKVEVQAGFYRIGELARCLRGYRAARRPFQANHSCGYKWSMQAVIFDRIDKQEPIKIKIREACQREWRGR